MIGSAKSAIGGPILVMGATGAQGVIRPQTLDQHRLEFSGFIQGGGLVAPPEFISEIGTLLPIAPCGRNSLYSLRQSSIFSRASARVRNQCWFRHSARKRPLKVRREKQSIQ
jgi:hypothetical protein